MHTNTFCEYRKKLRASPRVHLVNVSDAEMFAVMVDQYSSSNGLLVHWNWLRSCYIMTEL